MQKCTRYKYIRETPLKYRCQTKTKDIDIQQYTKFE